MRDGIFKTLSMAPVWRRFMLSCARAADRGDRTREAAIRALVRDVRAEISPSVLSALRSHTSSQQRQLNGLGTALPQLGAAADCTPMEKILRLNLARHAQNGMDGPELLQATLGDTFEAWGRQRMRQVEQQISLRDVVDARPALQEARTTTSHAAKLLANEFASAGELPTAKGRRARFDLDEDLGGPQ